MLFAIEKKIHRKAETKHPFFSTSIDYYFKWLPYATVFILHLARVKTRSDWKRQVLIAASTDAIRYLITDNLKKMVHEHRPAPYTGHRSFPSGHTSSSFAGAEFMHEELKSSIPVLSFAGYVAATATGVIRLYKSRHWLKDVVAGAVIGIASAKLARFLMNRLRKKKKHREEQTDPSLREEKMQSEVV